MSYDLFKVVENRAAQETFLKARFVIFRCQKYVKKGYIEMTKKIYLEPLKSVLGCSILHYCRKWFIGFFLGENEDMLRLDHLIGSNTDWKRPLHDGIQN